MVISHGLLEGAVLVTPSPQKDGLKLKILHFPQEKTESLQLTRRCHACSWRIKRLGGGREGWLGCLQPPQRRILAFVSYFNFCMLLLVQDSVDVLPGRAASDLSPNSMSLQRRASLTQNAKNFSPNLFVIHDYFPASRDSFQCCSSLITTIHP